MVLLTVFLCGGEYGFSNIGVDAILRKRCGMKG